MRSGQKKDNLIKSKKRVQKYGEVYTPEHIVKDMCDMLESENKDEDVFRLSSTFLEPACGNGNFLVEILSRKLDRCKSEDDCIIAVSSIYGIDILKDNVEESKQRMLEIVSSEYGFVFSQEKIKPILDSRIICGDSLKIMKELETKEWNEING